MYYVFMETFDLQLSHILISLLLIILCAGISLFLGLKLEKKILLAVIRSTIQVAALGYILRFIFKHNVSPTFFAVFAVMLVAAVAGMIWLLLHLKIFEAVKLGEAV